MKGGDELDDAKQLIPPWTAEDYAESAEPYQWLYEQRNKNKFLFLQLFNKTVKAANKAGVTTQMFKQMWKAYVEAMEPKTTILGVNTTAFPLQEKVLTNRDVLQCGSYSCNENGVSYIGRMGEEIQVISHPLMPVKRIINIDTFEEKVQIAFYRSAAEGWKTLIVGSEVLSSAQRIIALSRNGISVNSENAKEVVKYLSSLKDLNYDDLSLQKSASHLGWLPNGQFAPFDQDIEYDGESDEFARLYDGFRQEGSEQAWLDIAKQVRSGKSVPARIALAASFAAPLVQKLGVLSFFVHFWGLQGSGKTVALLLAASVWGNPQIGGYIKSFSGTKVSQELYAAFCGNLPVLLDELQVISDRKSFDDIIYSLCEGVSKGRGAKDGGLQTSRRWATVFLTTGEMPIVQSNSGGGAAVRTIEVNYGGEPFFEDARTVANTLKQNYGFAGRKFIDALREEGTMDALRDIQKDYYTKLAGDIQDKQVLSASLLLAADKLADIAVFQDGKALTVEEIKPYLITQEQADINQRAYTFYYNWLSENAGHFSDNPEDNKGQQWGKIEKDKKSGIEIAYCTKNVFEKTLSDNKFPPASFYSWAKRRNLLKTRRWDANDIKKTIGDLQPWCIAVVLPKKESEIDIPPGCSDVSDDDDLPF